MTSPTFSFKRLGLLIKLELAEKGKGNLMISLLLWFLITALMTPLALSEQFNDILLFFHALALFMILIFGGSLLTGNIFSQYGSTNTGISAIMIPASRLEKFLALLIPNLIIIVSLTLFFLWYHHWTIEFANEKILKDPFYEPLPQDMLQYFISAHFIIQGIVALGSIYFRKLAYIKTASIFILLLFSATGYSVWYSYNITPTPSKAVAFPFSGWKLWFYNLNTFYKVNFPDNIQMLIYLFPIFMLLSLWFIAYVRLKEKEI